MQGKESESSQEIMKEKQQGTDEKVWKKGSKDLARKVSKK